ncbi:hypothetical protein FKB34_08305 [Glycocaulis profundi]|nr:hypothetical protein FKB34_08305 [Glycocaulis profundi]
MGLLFGVIAALGAVIVLAWLFSRMDGRSAGISVRALFGVAGIVFGAGLALRGLPVIGVPLALAGLGFLSAVFGIGRHAGKGGQDGPPPRTRAGAMTVKEALDVLGLKPDATDDEIHAAYRELMKKVHPDTGGTNALAARVRQARDTLLG